MTQKFYKQQGFSHHLLLPILAVFAVGVLGIATLKLSSAATPCTSRTYKVGSKSTCVKYIQRAYNGFGAYWKYSGSAKIAVDGIYGAKLKTQTKAFQKFSGLMTSGTVDAKTWKLICADAGTIKQNKLSGYPAIYDAYKAAKSAGCTI